MEPVLRSPVTPASCSRPSLIAGSLHLQNAKRVARRNSWRSADGFLPRFALAAACHLGRAKRARTWRRALEKSLGILSSVSELPKADALGIELRHTAALAAPVNVQNGEFLQEPFRIRHELTEDVEQNAAIIGQTVLDLIKHFNWKTVVGCSFTKDILGHICKEDGDYLELQEQLRQILKKSVRNRVSFFYASIHTLAAGYNELVWGRSASKDVWSHKTILVCTLGKNIGAVLFSDGKRVRNSPLNELFTSHWQASLPATADLAEKFAPPAPEDAAFDAWADKLDEILLQVVSGVSHLDRVVLVPTGRTARSGGSLSEALMKSERMKRVREHAERDGTELIVSQPEHEASLVRGIALGAIFELQSEMALKSMEHVLEGAKTVDSLSEPQLRSIFDKIDADADGGLQPTELREVLSLLGIQRDLDRLVAELDTSRDGTVSFEEFMEWWDAEVSKTRCVVITSADAWNRIVMKSDPPEGFGQLILLKVTFTFCRSCRAFEPKWRRYSEQEEFKAIRFIELVGNGTIGAMELCTKQLGVKVSPAFYVFRRGGELLAQWTGANTERFETHLRECVEKYEKTA